MKKLCFVLPGTSIFTLAFFFAFYVTTIHAQTQAPPKPGPELKKLAAWVGQWGYEGDEKKTPLGTAGHFTGKTVSRLIANGFVLEQRWAEKSGDGLDLIWYDTAAKSYRFQSFEPSGGVTSGSATVNENTLIATGVRVDAKGQRAHVRWTSTLSSDGKASSTKQECSLDEGKTWLIWWEMTSKKSGK